MHVVFSARVAVEALRFCQRDPLSTALESRSTCFPFRPSHTETEDGTRVDNPARSSSRMLAAGGLYLLHLEQEAQLVVVNDALSEPSRWYPPRLLAHRHLAIPVLALSMSMWGTPRRGGVGWWTLPPGINVSWRDQVIHHCRHPPRSIELEVLEGHVGVATTLSQLLDTPPGQRPWNYVMHAVECTTVGHMIVQSPATRRLRVPPWVAARAGA